MSVVSQIKHYQQSIEKCTHDEKRLLHCIEKLYKLPVTVQHLQDTGVGRTVNALRKYDGTVGDAAKALVAKWKTMVVDEKISEGEDDDDQNQPDVQDGYSDNSDVGAEKESFNHKESRQSEHKSSRHESKRKGDQSTSKENSRTENEKKSSRSSHESRDSKKEKDRDRKDKEKHSRDRETSKKEEPNNKSTHKSSDSSRKESTSKVSKENKEVNGDDVSRKRKLDQDRSQKIPQKRRKISTSENSEDADDDQILPAISSSSSSASPSPRLKSESPPPKPKTESKDSRESKHDKKDKSKSDRHKSSLEKSDKKSEKSKDSSKLRHQSSSSREKSEKSEKNETSKEKKSSDSSREKSKHHKSKSPDKKKMKKHLNGDDGIDCNSGASFAEALGMCSHPVAKKKGTAVSPSSPVMKPPKSEPSTSKQKVTKTETPMKDDGLSLLAPNVKLAPLNVDLASTLPEISPNYKPLPANNYLNSAHRRIEEEKALNDVMYAKNVRTKVYSGAKTGCTSVPSLYELCIRVLIENIEALEATGGVPYDILKPVLEKATPDQLFTLEHHNPYLIEDTDTLWKFHCNREFRSQQREEMESWREMYMRCLDEREAKLKTLTANIKQSIDKSVPVRSAKLAYVDNVVKPPRGVLRKQAKYGTAHSSSNSTSDIKRKIISGANSVTNISVPPPPISRVRASSGIVKKNKAPLMAKALQLIKGRYKR